MQLKCRSNWGLIKSTYFFNLQSDILLLRIGTCCQQRWRSKTSVWLLLMRGLTLGKGEKGGRDSRQQRQWQLEPAAKPLIIHKQEYTNTQTHKYTNMNTQIHKHTNTQTHKYTNTQIHRRKYTYKQTQINKHQYSKAPSTWQYWEDTLSGVKSEMYED